MDQLNPTESLEIISKAIHQTKENFKEQVVYFILWGWVSLIASIINYYLAAHTSFQYPYLPWLILVPIALIFHFRIEKKRGKAKKIQSYYDLYLKYLWSVLGGSFIAIIIYTSYFDIPPTSFLLLLAGMGTLITGLTIEFKPISWGGLALLLFSFVALFVSPSQTLLVYCLAIILGYLVPAYMLGKDKK